MLKADHFQEYVGYELDKNTPDFLTEDTSSTSILAGITDLVAAPYLTKEPAKVNKEKSLGFNLTKFTYEGLQNDPESI